MLLQEVQSLPVDWECSSSAFKLDFVSELIFSHRYSLFAHGLAVNSSNALTSLSNSSVDV